MEWPTLNARVLYASIVAHPEADLPRLQLADELDEFGAAGDRARAHYIRVCFDRSVPGRWKGRQFVCLRDELRAAHERDWRRAGPCPACKGTGRCYRFRPPEGCGVCAGTGDCGGLLCKFEYPDPCSLTAEVGGPTTPDGAPPAPVRVEWRRGFPSAVTVPRVTDCVSECPQCSGPGRFIDRPEGERPICHVCKGAGRLPTPWLRAVCTHHPIEGAVPLDREPWSSGAWFGWCKTRTPPRRGADESEELPPPVFDPLEDSIDPDESGWKKYSTREAAVAALGRALAAFGRGEAADGRAG